MKQFIDPLLNKAEAKIKGSNLVDFPFPYFIDVDKKIVREIPPEWRRTDHSGRFGERSNVYEVLLGKRIKRIHAMLSF